MSDPVQNFEFILKQHSTKRSSGLYSDNKQQNKHTYKPQDVISSVFLQLKAIQQADSLKSVKCIEKDLQKYKNCNFPSVNKLPAYEEVPKQTTKFDTQCISDTQLINIIEDAEIVDVQQGTTQEFETTFSHHTEKYNTEDEEITTDAHNAGSDKKSMDKIHENITEDVIRTKSDSLLDNSTHTDDVISLISPIMCSNNVRDNKIGFDSQDSKVAENTQLEVFSQILKKCKEIEDKELTIERPLSPIFMHKKVKPKSKTPSPLVFNLDKFEQFENIAIPILEANDLKTAKHVINSQILDKELHIKIDEEIQLNNIDILSPVLHNKNVKHVHSPVLESETEFKSYVVKNPDSDTDLEFIEFDKETSNHLINKIMNKNPESNVKAKPESEILKDEILFSSDEEESYVHKYYQDLPLTCALETSFYDQSDVLDKTMYVGFQTASNKTIQILSESFAQANNLLNDVPSDEISVTDLVKNCDSYVKNKTQDGDLEQVKKDSVYVERELNLAEKDNKESEFIFAIGNTVEENILLVDSHIKPPVKTNFEGFMTASNKVIRLSDKALSRCRKVFQDIDINENFDNQTERDNAASKVKFYEDKIPVTTEISKPNINKTLLDDDIQNIDDVIMQEFENIEMSLEEDKKIAKNVASIGFKTASKMKDVFKDIDFDEDFSEFETRETNKEVNALPKIIEDPQLIKNINDQNFEGFKTASNKNIDISKEALAQTKNLFQDLGSTKFPKKSIKSLDKINQNCVDFNMPSTSNAGFVGFKTANNKQIKISDQALDITKDIFKDIDSIDFKLPKKKTEDMINNKKEHIKPLISKTNFVGFKTENNKNMNISKEALAKTKNVFKDIDSADFQLPKNNNKDLQEDKLSEEIQGFIDFDQPSTSKISFGGFKTANNRVIKISDAVLANTTIIFKDIDSADFGLEKNIRELAKVEEGKLIKKVKVDKAETVYLNQPSTATSGFVGFKTANNKEIKISDTALAKTKSIFDKIDSDELGYPKKVTTDSKEQFGVRMRADYDKNNSDDMEIKDLNLSSTSKASFGGIKMVNNGTIEVSKEGLAKTNNIFKDFNRKKENNLIERKNEEILQKGTNESHTVWNQPSTSKASFAGFQTANNRKISISEESLAKTRNIFKDTDCNHFKLPEKLNKEFKEKGKEGKSAYPDLKDFKHLPQSGSSFVGFKTANNKVINVSEIALAKTKKIFNDIDSTELQLTEKCKEDYPNIEEGSNQLARDFHESHAIGKYDPITEKNTILPKFQGFQTASNKHVKVSADALLKTRKIFEDMDDLNVDSFKNKDVLHTENGFDTVDEPLHINKETDDVLISGKTSPIFKGFQTSNNKPVTVSKEALAISKKVFQDIDIILNDDDFQPAFHGFKTVNDKVVSDKVLTETKELFDDSKSFGGFQTAGDKKVVISEDSLVTCRKIFQDLDTNDKSDLNKKSFGKKPSNINFGFKTGTNRDIVISEEAIARSKRLFSDIDDSNDNQKKNKKDKIIIEENVANIIDTQVLNNFEESLHTEDFHDTPIKSKRSGSPILSCPRAKKKQKFETPYSQKVIIKPEIKNEIINRNVNKISFNETYKKNKKYTLKDLAKLTQNDSTTIDPYLLQFNFDNLLQFKFLENRNGLSYGNMTIDLLKDLFLNSVNSKLVPNGWLDNHLKLILWKLISYEVKLKSTVVCSARNVVDQLKYRYDKELYNAQRPALRKILEKDDVAAKTVVFCVAGIYANDVNVSSATTTNNIELLLTDGWYCVKASIDKMLAQLVCAGKIEVGTKIVTNGAELVGCEQGISPWEDTSAVRIKLFGNSTRRARWDARLGYHSNGAILSQLSSVKLDGGKVSKLRVFVTRVYPALYVEKFEDGSTVTRSERLEHLHQMKSEAERQAIMEKIYEEVEKEFSDQESQDSEGLSDSGSKRTCLDSGSQIAQVMKRSKDPGEFRACLTSSQTRLLEAHTSKRREILLQDIQTRIRDKVEKAGVCVNRNVVTLLKIRIAGVTEKNGVEVTKGMMSIWKPNDAILEIIKEGTWIDIMNVVPTAVRYSEIQISAGRQSIFSTSKYKQPEKFNRYTTLLKRSCYALKDLSQNPSMSSDYNEIDTVGFIFLVDPSVQEFDSTKQPFQNVFLTDSDKNMICINFWGGLKKFGYQNVLDTGQAVACANLQKRAGNTRKSIPQYRVTEFSYFTKTPKNENARNMLDSMNKRLLTLDRRKFCEDCIILKNNYSIIKHSEHISPYRFHNSDFNMSKNKIFIDSPLTRLNKIDDNFNLTGLDFESSFKQTETQLPEEVLLRKKKVNEKIARLKMYGEPPPLSTIHILNKSKNASSSYKSPLISNNDNAKNITQKRESAKLIHSKPDSSVNVASFEETPERCANLNESDVTCSPVLLNRTYVKSVNPVKINFDMKDNNDSNVDHFAEEFDGSPPLSLD